MTSDTHVFLATHVASRDVNLCAYSRWSKHFPNNIPPAEVLAPVPQAFLDYLNSDSIRVPTNDTIAANSDNEYSDWEDDAAEDPVAAFSDFDKQLRAIVARWKQVVVKLNWSAPKDAKWIVINNSLQCTSVADIYLLLNASDHIAHDLDGRIYDECEDSDGERLEPELVVKKWIADFNPALEFRVFVRDRKILGATQRDLNHYQFLADIQPKLHDALQTFQQTVLRGSTFPLRDYIMDVYIPRPYTSVTVLDINPFTRKWNPLLYTWHELLDKENNGEFDVRILTETNLGAMARKDNSESQVPIEVVDALLNLEAMVELAKQWHSLGNEQP